MNTAASRTVIAAAWGAFPLLLAGCGGPKSPAPTPPDARFVITAVGEPLATSDSVVVYWTRVSSMEHIFGPLEGFARAGTLPAVPAPFGGGGLPGDVLFDLARKAAGPEGFSEVLLRQARVGVDPRAPGSAISVGDGADEYYNNYVARNAANELIAFLVLVGRTNGPGAAR